MVCGTLHLHFFFVTSARNSKRPSGREVGSPLTDIVCSLQRKQRAWQLGRVPLQTGALERKKKGELQNELLCNGCRFITYTWYYYAESFMYLLMIPISEFLLTSWELWGGKPRKQDSSALYQCQKDTAHGCRAYHGYWSVYRGTRIVNILHEHRT